LPAKIAPPIVIDLGRTRRAHVVELSRGVGRLADEVEEVMRQIRASTGPQREDRVFLPIVALYTKRR